jgi:hypothetical protein
MDVLQESPVPLVQSNALEDVLHDGTDRACPDGGVPASDPRSWLAPSGTYAAIADEINAMKNIKNRIFFIKTPTSLFH